MERIRRLFQRYWPAVYWLLFACLAARGATFPPLMERFAPLPPYSLLGVAIVWAVFALATWWLSRLTSPGDRPHRVPLKLQVALFIMAMLFLISPSTYTDQGGLVGAIGLFGFMCLIMLGAHGLSAGFSAIARRIGKAPSKTGMGSDTIR